VCARFHPSLPKVRLKEQASQDTRVRDACDRPTAGTSRVPGKVGFMVLKVPFRHTHPLLGKLLFGPIPHTPPTTVPALLIPNGTVTAAEELVGQTSVPG